MLVSKTMPNTTTETPDWLREMETILEELNEGVVVVDDQLRVVFANEALTRMDISSAARFRAVRPSRFSRAKTFPLSNANTNRPTVTPAIEPSSTFPVKTVARSQQSSCLDDMLGVEGLEDLVLQSAKLPLADMQKTILDGVAAWRHGPLADDVSLVIVEVR